MPRGDRTGPLGLGSRTGRAAGFCAGYNVPGFVNPIPGRGFWRGKGGGRGHRYMYYATGLPAWAHFTDAPQVPLSQAATEQELDYLKDQAEYLQNTLGDINKRITELEKDDRNK